MSINVLVFAEGHECLYRGREDGKYDVLDPETNVKVDECDEECLKLVLSNCRKDEFQIY